jgi:agmatine deiminase
MITDKDTNFVYLSAWTKTDFQDISKKLIRIFEKTDVGYDFLQQTDDYYCRDYMPVQVTRDTFVQFVFNPVSYFKPKELKHISNPVKIQINNKLAQPYYSRLILDGGNVVKGETKVIISDKVIRDNEYMMPREKIIEELETLLEAEVIIIPALKKDKTGHTDGMIRFIDDNTVLINELGYDEEWEEEFLAVLKNHGLKSEQLYIFEDEDEKKPGSAVGIYINYLHVGKLIVVPYFDHPEQKNEEVLKRMKELFPNSAIEHVNATKLAKEGGVLNCVTWNILT